MNTTVLTINQLYKLMDKHYTLVYLDSNCNLNSSAKILIDCIKEKSVTPLLEHISDCFAFYEQDRIAEIIEELKSTCSSQGYSNEQIDLFFKRNADTIREEIQNRDDSNVVEELLRNTNDMPIRIEMHSNYDCINSHYFEEQYSYSNTYFGDMVDRLNLNPHEVKRVFTEHGIKCEGNFPNLSDRNGNEAVNYLQFAQEISNSVSPANLLTFMANINVIELYKTEFSIGQITLPKGNCCGLYSPTHGGGSIMEMELQRNITISLKGITNFDYCALQIDADTDNSYSLKNVYGVIDSFFGKTAILHKEDLMFCHLGNGITVCDRTKKEHGDYLTVAHISCNRSVTYYAPLSQKAKERIEKFAATDNMTSSATQPYLVLKPILNL